MKAFLGALAGVILATQGALSAPLAAPAGVADDTIRIRSDRWCPYNCDPSGSLPGYAIEIVKAIYEPANPIEFAEMNWARSLEEARKGRTQAVIGAAKSDAPDFIFPDLSIGVSKFCFYTRKTDTWTFTGYASLESVSLATVNGYSYGDGLDGILLATPMIPNGSTWSRAMTP